MSPAFIRILILIASCLPAASSVAQFPVSSEYEVIYTSRQTNNLANEIYPSATLSVDGRQLLHSNNLEGRVILVDLTSLKEETIKVDRLHHAVWFASDSEHVFELRMSRDLPAGTPRSSLIINPDVEQDLLCYKTIDDYRKNQPLWFLRRINIGQFIVRWVPELQRFLLSDVEGKSTMSGPSTLSVLSERGERMAEFEVEGSMVDFDVDFPSADNSNSNLVLFHRPTLKSNSVRVTKYSLKSKKHISSEALSIPESTHLARRSSFFHFGCSTQTRYIKLRDFKTGDVIDYYQNLLSERYLSYTDVPAPYFGEYGPKRIWFQFGGMRQWNLNQLSAAKADDMPEIFRTDTAGFRGDASLAPGPEFALSRDGHYWWLGWQSVVDGCFSDGKRLLVTRQREQDKKASQVVTRVIRLK